MVREGKQRKSDYQDWLSFLDGELIDMDYKHYLLSTIAERENVESKRKQKDLDYNLYDEEEIDPRYACFLESLKEHDKSYVSEYEENGLIVTLKYEGDSSSDRECVGEERDGPSVIGVKSLSRLQTRSMKAREINEKAKLCNLIKDDPPKEKLSRRRFRNNPKEEDISIVDPEYDILLKNFNREYAYGDADRAVVYEVNEVREEHNDGSYSDVETLDSSTFYKMNSSLGKSTSQCEFRVRVMSALREPFDEEEYEKLWQDIKVRKPEERHLDLRNGRERSYQKQSYGKSYLDHHPGLKRKLLQVEDDKPKCLNLLRGFFLWLQQPDWFSPWLDEECLAIYPEST